VTDIAIVDLEATNAADQIDAACRSVGFFAIANHGVTALQRNELLDTARAFFELDDATKQQVSLAQGGAAWRGWFPLGGELTSGIADLKEGYYFGRELPVDARPMHGPNIWPTDPGAFERIVTTWMIAMESLGQHVLSLMAEGLGLEPSFFQNELTADPTPLFRIFRYPPHLPVAVDRWGVGEHSDYGLLTLLAHDGTPGLEVKVGSDWIEAPSDPDLIICNLGDMLDRLTSGRYRSTPHRVRNQAQHDRYSFPFFLDPSWDATIRPLTVLDSAKFADGSAVSDDVALRWDRANLRTITGTYGEWLQAKVSKVFPSLAEEVLRP
jgi:isopenicillin N synthase-like dioxygenase